MSTNSDIAQAIATALSERLCTWQARIVPIGAYLDVLPGRQRPIVIRMEIHPEYRGRVDREGDVFAQENAVLIQIERDCQGAFRWDEGLLADPCLLGRHGISHYLADQARLPLILEFVSEHAPLSDETRRLGFEDIAA
ncbi:hypothetical protein [Miltoncostaea oceani]|uniref:hypothetical protein n=1 Tax=Miltoncostaea oceani TaxID=2843216 RepID=UPI001C3E3C46|nr:hypothetical protein [Miltoncostaea oceani]